MFGLIWFIQIVHYPLFAGVDAVRFIAYERAHARLTTWVVGPAMVLEALSSVLLFWHRPDSVPVAWVWIGAGLLAAIWLSTALVQVPLHRRLQTGFDGKAHRALVESNWARTAAWTARAVLALMMVHAVAFGPNGP